MTGKKREGKIKYVNQKALLAMNMKKYSTQQFRILPT